MSHSSKRVRKNRQSSSAEAPATVPFEPSVEGCEKCKPLDDYEVTVYHPLAILPDFSIERSMSYRELRLLQIVRKAVDAAVAVLDEHGDRCEAHGCQICRHAKALLWSLEMAHGALESELPVS